jgi:4-diphosphocytidyl-2-C-methyl-D-erythritol kinase
MKTYKSLCPAKINLFLKILSKRTDGFHELESLFAFIDLADELQVELGDQFEIKITGEFSQFVDQKNNLFTKILDWFVDEFAVSKNLKITIKKNIPVGSGLGGGSSNAAYFIRALNEIFALDLDKKRMQEISLKFGSDIAFFFEDRASLVSGRGENLKNFTEFDPLSALLIHPKISLSTREIFHKLAGNFSPKIGVNNLEKMSILDLLKLPNDLENPAIATLPLIKEIISELKNSGANFSKMSGSGSACFGIFDDQKNLAQAAVDLKKKFPNFFVREVLIR